MKIYIVTLQLVYLEEKYPNLISYLKSAVFWTHPVKNVWIVKTPKTAVEIRDGINPLINTYLGDKVLVTALQGGDWATNNIDLAITNWMKENL